MMLQLSEAADMLGSSSPRKGRAHIFLRNLSTFLHDLLREVLTGWIGRSFNCIEKLHGLDIVEVYLMLKHNYEPLSRHFGCQDSCWKS